eukprot:CAMPEP_0170091058 /NCGR_PEP_ID=MMETSP0019_2-20121128/24745_1 /TAXON_ID=98059 /ORGANISM="Dinobryon sp., Strain UTEXLB2267" /LENGTH=79 /DNA_ID=CAMNT_0010310747 /DNA_START=185 /DNA_END=421 /DNA_ORIENTATION=+
MKESCGSVPMGHGLVKSCANKLEWKQLSVIGIVGWRVSQRFNPSLWPLKAKSANIGQGWDTIDEPTNFFLGLKKYLKNS